MFAISRTRQTCMHQPGPAPSVLAWPYIPDRVWPRETRPREGEEATLYIKTVQRLGSIVYKCSSLMKLLAFYLHRIYLNQVLVYYSVLGSLVWARDRHNLGWGVASSFLHHTVGIVCRTFSTLFTVLERVLNCDMCVKWFDGILMMCYNSMQWSTGITKSVW